MIYVSSDWHGWPLAEIQKLLEKANFGENDFLFVLGDVIDRGEEGVELLRWLVNQPNIQMLMGNHEDMMLACDFLFQEVTDESLDSLTADEMDLLYGWNYNGAAPTIEGLQKLLQEDPDAFEGIVEYLRELPLYEVVEAGGRTFLLVHGGLGNFSPEKKLSEYTPYELFWTRPRLDERYFEDITVILGHTPTLLFGFDYAGKILHTDTWICVDAGCATGMPPALLRLDDMQEFYLR